MTSLLKRNGPKFHCSNCMMEVHPQEGQLPICCSFCGSIFSNWSSIIIDNIIDEEIAIEEYKKELKHTPNPVGGN